MNDILYYNSISNKSILTISKLLTVWFIINTIVGNFFNDHFSNNLPYQSLNFLNYNTTMFIYNLEWIQKYHPQAYFEYIDQFLIYSILIN